MTPLMRWRSRHRQMSFEPYGIGIEKSVAESLSIQPVKYYQRGRTAHKQENHETERWQTQSEGVKTDWRAEDEYRHKGDVSLKALRPEDLMLFCHTAYEAECLKGRFDIEAVPYISG